MAPDRERHASMQRSYGNRAEDCFYELRVTLEALRAGEASYAEIHYTYYLALRRRLNAELNTHGFILHREWYHDVAALPEPSFGDVDDRDFDPERYRPMVYNRSARPVIKGAVFRRIREQARRSMV